MHKTDYYVRWYFDLNNIFIRSKPNDYNSSKENKSNS